MYNKQYIDRMHWVDGRARQKRLLFLNGCVLKWESRCRCGGRVFNRFWGSDIKSPTSSDAGSIQPLGVTGCEQLSIYSMSACKYSKHEKMTRKETRKLLGSKISIRHQKYYFYCIQKLPMSQYNF